MANEQRSGSAVELLRYPLTVFSILLALIIAKWTLGISFGHVSEVGPSGVKFARDTKEEITDLAGKLNAAIAAIEELKKASKQPPSAEAKAAIAAAMQTVPDHTARFAAVSAEAKADDQRRRGYIWIGDYRRGWERIKLGHPQTGEPIQTAPDKLTPGSEYKVLGNMVLRDGLPPDDADYFRARRSIGVAPVGTRVRLLSAPTAVDRVYANQYWAEVELL